METSKPLPKGATWRDKRTGKLRAERRQVPGTAARRAAKAARRRASREGVVS